LVVEGSVGDCLSPLIGDVVRGFDPTSWSTKGYCNIPVQGLIGLIGDSYQQVATSFLEAHLPRTLKLSVLGLEKFRDG